MKNVVPDITDVIRTRYISQLGRLRKFERMWGTTIVDGHKVLKARHVFYPSMSAETRKLAEYLGCLSDLSGKQEGIESAWLYLNPNKAKDTEVEFNTAILARNMSKAFKGGIGVTVSINPKIVQGTMINPNITTPDSDQEGLIAEIISKYKSFWDNDFLLTVSEEEKYAAIVLTYLLRSSDIPFEITKVESKLASYSYAPGGNPKKIKTIQGKKWQVTIDVPDTIINPDTDIISMLLTDLALVSARRRSAIAHLFKANVTSQLMASFVDTANSPFDPDNDEIEYEPLPVSMSDAWYQKGRTWYLKASFLTNPSLPREDRIRYVFDLIDSDYKKKKLKWYEVAIAIVVVVVLTYFAGPAGTAAGAAFTTGAVVAVVTIAVTISVAAMYIALAAMALHYLGAPNVSAALGTFQRQIAPLVRVANIIAIVAVISRIVQAGLERATEIAAKKAAEQGITEGVKVSAMTAIKEISVEFGKVAIETLTGIPTTEPFQLQHALKTVDIAFGLYQKNELSKISDKIESLQKELAKEKALEESSQVSDLVKDMMMTYPNPLSNDHSEYASIYDKPYEWWSTEFHTGNIQNTDVSALWLSDV